MMRTAVGSFSLSRRSLSLKHWSGDFSVLQHSFALTVGLPGALSPHLVPALARRGPSFLVSVGGYEVPRNDRAHFNICLIFIFD